MIVRALTPKHQAHVGKSVTEIANGLNKTPDDVYVDLILDEANPVVFTFDGNRRELRGGRGSGEDAAAPGRAEGRGGRGGGGETALPPGTWTKHPQFGPGSDSLPVDMDEPVRMVRAPAARRVRRLFQAGQGERCTPRRSRAQSDVDAGRTVPPEGSRVPGKRARR